MQNDPNLKWGWLIIYLICLALVVGCGKPSLIQSYQQTRVYLEQAGSIYSAIGDLASKDAQRQVNKLDYGQQASNETTMRLIVAFSLHFEAERCAELRIALGNFEAKEKLQEKVTTEEYNKFIESFDELSKSADNFVTNEKITEVMSAAERLELHKARPLVKRAYDLANATRPKE